MNSTTIKVYEKGNVKIAIERLTNKAGDESFHCVRLVDNNMSSSQVVHDVEDALDLFQYWLDIEIGEDL